MTKKLLVADDSSTIQKVIKIAFSKFDVRILEASSFVEAGRIAATQRPDGIIVDANIVGSSGPGDLKKLQDSAGGCPMLVLAGSYESVDPALFRNHGIQHILQKPFDTKDIIAKLAVDLNLRFSPIDSRPEGIAPAPARGGGEGVSDGFSPEMRASFADAPPPVSGDPFETLRGFSDELDSEIPFTDSNAKGTRAFNPGQGMVETKPVKPSATQSPRGAGSAHPDHRLDELRQNMLGDRKATDIPVRSAPPVPATSSPMPPSGKTAQSGDTLGVSRDEIRQMIVPVIREEVQQAVRGAVNDYCASHFNDLARELILEELRRLAEEKSRYLTDR